MGTHARRTACRGKLSNGELLPTLEEFIDVALHAGTTRLWLDVKRIEVGGATSNTAESVKACSRACEIIREKKAQHFCEFIVSGNAAIWAGCYSAAQLARHQGRLDELLGAFGL